MLFCFSANLSGQVLFKQVQHEIAAKDEKPYVPLPGKDFPSKFAAFSYIQNVSRSISLNPCVGTLCMCRHKGKIILMLKMRCDHTVDCFLLNEGYIAPNQKNVIRGIAAFALAKT